MSGSTVDTKPGSDVPGSTPASTTGVTSSSHANLIPKAIVKNVDMSDEMQQAAVDIASDAMTKYTVEKDIAAHVKKTMDTRFGPTWHAVVGKNYGSYVTHETKHFIYFYLGQIAFLLWRA
ncbi:putative dynein light chain 1, cytoplasmic [Meira miltonrushii]|uniref:Dynein light chain n=1 Tax=Meira miltonrushii TaxID=1280837 RepID=A0A316VHP3_9BASI|nr:putative dynein light chain 1, cytoplasmic [Meira miltonrushii]PWN37177.1 putative dynein light chain 1, cytoplasmic [Meira miltonrushii]